MKVSPSIIAADFSRLGRELARIAKAAPDFLHLDIMDGVFVPNMTFGPMVVEAINRMTPIKLDVHLMIANPYRYLSRYLDAGADLLSFHAEAAPNIAQCIAAVRARRKKVGLAISPPTRIERIARYLERIDFILIMSVNPGFYGQKFKPEALEKIRQAREYITRRRLRCFIEVDGGIDEKNACELKAAGADIVVAGAGVFKMRDYVEAVGKLRCSTA